MRALHLPGLEAGGFTPYSFPDRTPPPSVLHFSADFPKPNTSGLQESDRPQLLIRVLTTALTRGELSWSETLDPQRWDTYGGAVPGHDFVGIIESIHGRQGVKERGVEDYLPGTKVWGLLAFDRNGAAAEFTVAHLSEVARAPSSPPKIDEKSWDEQLATIPLSGLSAWQALFDHGGLAAPSIDKQAANRGKRILVLGAAGTVGNQAVQFGKAAGCFVIATCNRRNAKFVRDILGADEVLDYTDGVLDVAAMMSRKGIPQVDVIIDTIGGEMLKGVLLSDDVVSSGGRVVSIAHPLQAYEHDVQLQIASSITKRGVDFEFFIVKPDGTQLTQISAILRSGITKAIVNSLHGLEDGRTAMEKVETRGAVDKGKVVLRIG